MFRVHVFLTIAVLLFSTAGSAFSFAGAAVTAPTATGVSVTGAGCEAAETCHNEHQSEHKDRDPCAPCVAGFVLVESSRLPVFAWRSERLAIDLGQFARPLASPPLKRPPRTAV